jgi:hypothetical protein
VDACLYLFTVRNNVINIKAFSRPPAPSIIPTGQTAQGGLFMLITAYLLLPSALCRITPYLFLCGVSGSAKSTIGKLAASLYGVPINSSGDTFAAIRNSLDERKFKHIEVPASEGSIMPFNYVETDYFYRTSKLSCCGHTAKDN